MDNANVEMGLSWMEFNAAGICEEFAAEKPIEHA